MRTNQWPLVLASCLITAGFLLLTFSQWPGSECHVLSEWWSARQANSLYANASLEQPSSDPLALAQLGSVTYHALRESGWRSGVFYARCTSPRAGLACVGPSVRRTGWCLFDGSLFTLTCSQRHCLTRCPECSLSLHWGAGAHRSG